MSELSGRRKKMPLNQDPVPPSGCGSRHVPRASGRRRGRHRFSSWEVLLHLFPCALGEDSPEEAFAAFTGHGVEVKACGSVSTYPTDAGHIPVKVAKVRQRSASCHCLHPTRTADRPRPELEAVLFAPLHPICWVAQQSPAAPQVPGLSRISLAPLLHDSPYLSFPS